MATSNDDIIEVEKLDFFVQYSEHNFKRPYLIVTSDSTTGRIVDSRVEISPKQTYDSQLDSDPKAD